MPSRWPCSSHDEMNTEQKDTISRYRNEPYRGLSIDLVPIDESMLADIVRLRNQENSKYYLNQRGDLCIEQQAEWYDRYVGRDNDIYWCIRNKSGEIVGTVRLYDITDDRCEHGSFIVDEKYAMGAPYALEAMILSLDFAFKELKLRLVDCNDRQDNANMNSISRRLGFVFQEKHEINGVLYNHYILSEEGCKTDKYRPLLEKYVSGAD